MQEDFSRLIKIKSREEVRKCDKCFMQVCLRTDGSFSAIRSTSANFTLSLCDHIFRTQKIGEIIDMPCFVIQVDDKYIAVPVDDADVLPDIAVSTDTVSVIPQISFDDLFSGGNT